MVWEIVRERRRVVSGSRMRALREGVEVRAWRWAVAVASGSIDERREAVVRSRMAEGVGGERATFVLLLMMTMLWIVNSVDNYHKEATRTIKINFTRISVPQDNI